jgi:hypothetical protein
MLTFSFFWIKITHRSLSGFFNRLNEEGYGYGIYNPINLQFLLLESHGSQLSGAKNRTYLSRLDQIYLQGEYKKVLKN